MGTKYHRRQCMYRNTNSNTHLSKAATTCTMSSLGIGSSGISSIFVILIIALTGTINVAFADLPVGVTGKLNRGNNATFSCTHSGTLRQLTWSKTGYEGTSPNSNYILQYVVGDPLLYGPDIDSNHYELDKSTNEMTVLSITLDDEGMYWCEATTAEFADDVGSVKATINVEPVGDYTSITHNGEKYMNGETIKVDAGVQTFTCNTTGVKPAATFKWTPNPSSQTPSSTQNEGDIRLFDSSSEVTIEIMRPLSPTQIVCAASNTDVDVNITMNLELNDPCDGVMCENGGTCAIDPNDPSMPMCECPVGYEGELCGTEVTPTSKPGGGLQVWIIIVIVVVAVAIVGFVVVCCLVVRKCCCFS